MFWMTTKVREELQQRFQDDYRKVKWYLALRPLFAMFFTTVMVSLIILLSMLNVDLHHYPKWVWGIAIMLLIAPSIILTQRMERNYEITRRLQGTRYLKRSRLYGIIMNFVIFPLALVFLMIAILTILTR